MMQAGKLKRRITIQQKTITKDSSGIITETWADFVTLWASREPLAARWGEFFGAAAINAQDTIKYTVRYLSGKTIKPDMRVVDQGRTYTITAVLDDTDNDRRQTVIMAEELRNG